MVGTPNAYEFTERAGIPVLRFPALDATGVVDAVITTRHGGVSTGPYESLNLGLHVGDEPDAVVTNRARAAATIGLDLDDLVFCKQSHGPSVGVVGRSDRGRGIRSDDEAILDTDALVTADAGVGLVIMVADCVPIVAVDPDARVLACIHAGWRGTVAKVTAAAIEAMVGLGAEPERIVAGVGPAIPVERYQVGEEVADAARDAFGIRVDEVLHPDGTGRWRFDVSTANRLVLTDSGVRDDHVHLADIGTGVDFFSDRAARPCGRFAALARLLD